MKTTDIRRIIQNLTLILSVVLLAGCWTQNDTISIRGDGSVEFTSEVTITEKDFSAKDVEELSSEFMKGLKDAGWKIDRKIHTTKPPYRMTFSGSGNLKAVKDASDFYVLSNVNDQEFQIRFIPAETKGGKSSRSITFSNNLLAAGAVITDSSGKPITKIDNVNGENVYTIKLLPNMPGGKPIMGTASYAGGEDELSNTPGGKPIIGGGMLRILVLAIIGVIVATVFARRKRTPPAT